jgi:hypothetical protein
MAKTPKTAEATAAEAPEAEAPEAEAPVEAAPAAVEEDFIDEKTKAEMAMGAANLSKFQVDASNE